MLILGIWIRRILPAVAILIGAFATANANIPNLPNPAAPAQTDQSELAVCVAEARGLASWYGAHWRGRKTANGDRFDDRRLTAASLTLPLATHARVTNLQNGRSVDVLVNDRGPYVDGRIMDLSAAAAAALGMTRDGLAQVAITPQVVPESTPAEPGTIQPAPVRAVVRHAGGARRPLAKRA